MSIENNDTLGTKLHRLTLQTIENLFVFSRNRQLSCEAYWSKINQIKESAENPWKLTYPLGINIDGKIFNNEISYNKEELVQNFQMLMDFYLPLHYIYHLIAFCELFFNESLRLILREHPKKMGGDKEMKYSVLFKYKSYDVILEKLIDQFIHSLSYGSPKDFAKKAQSIYCVNLLDIECYLYYIELKATRDMYIHNKGYANDKYVEKAGDLARVKNGEHLPIDTQYYLKSNDNCLQLIFSIFNKFHEIWPSVEYEDYLKNKVNNIQIVHPSDVSQDSK